MPTAAEFARRMRALTAAVPKEMTEAQADGLSDAFEQIVAGSPVRFGYYRAGHAIGTGPDKPRAYLFEHPERPSAEGPYPPRPIIPGPDTGAARSATAQVKPFQRLVVYNSVRHAGFVEWGTALMAPRYVYERARTALAGRLPRIVERIERKLAALGR